MVEPSQLKFKYHGNYCGPNYGDPTGKTPAVDKLDEICKEHDLAYDTPGADLAEADFNAAKAAISDDPAFAYWFYIQSALRKIGFMPRKNGKKKGNGQPARASSQIPKVIRRAIADGARLAGASAKPGVGQRPRRQRASIGNLGVNTHMSRLPRGHFSWKSQGDRLVVKGCDYLDEIPAASAGVPRGTDVYNWVISPLNIQNSRLQLFCAMFEKYKFQKLAIHFSSAENTAIKGQYIHAIVPDPKDEQLSGRDLCNQLVSVKGHGIAKLMDSSTCQLPHHPGVPFQFVDPDGSDDRLTSQGTYHFAAYSDLQGENDISSYGALEVEYECVFDGISVRGTVQQDVWLQGINLSTAINTNSASLCSPVWFEQVETTGRPAALSTDSDGRSCLNLSAMGFRTGDVVQVNAFARVQTTTAGSASILYTETGLQLLNNYANPNTNAGSTTCDCSFGARFQVMSDKNVLLTVYITSGVTMTNFIGSGVLPPYVTVVRMYNGDQQLHPLSAVVSASAQVQMLLREVQEMKQQLLLASENNFVNIHATDNNSERRLLSPEPQGNPTRRTVGYGPGF